MRHMPGSLASFLDEPDAAADAAMQDLVREFPAQALVGRDYTSPRPPQVPAFRVLLDTFGHDEAFNNSKTLPVVKESNSCIALLMHKNSGLAIRARPKLKSCRCVCDKAWDQMKTCSLVTKSKTELGKPSLFLKDAVYVTVRIARSDAECEIIQQGALEEKRLARNMQGPQVRWHKYWRIAVDISREGHHGDEPQQHGLALAMWPNDVNELALHQVYDVATMGIANRYPDWQHVDRELVDIGLLPELESHLLCGHPPEVAELHPRRDV
eukprot:CAMPEP_0115549548 /NCGR_PEP_ID=MMETSP0271-20121206/94754_1 /TAXON_ID=71861 /ORGANISM="Scrippsiella trochoidea, Strain CCMP3099" /LENGTH=267 /DNA_ID=CAMNT_0002983085 /DNA_START=201 /DNA_END=1006 /DNA_ORIENTATION=-